MNQLTVINQNGQLLVESREVAELTGVRHSDLLEKINNYIKHLTNGKFRSLDFFIASTYEDAKGEVRPCFLLTRKGCDMVANKMTGERGVLFTAAYVTQFETMEKQLADPFANLSTELKAIFTVDVKVQKLESRIDEVDKKVETQITLTQGEQRRLQKAISSRIYDLEADKEARSPMFSELHREIKDRWGVPSYRDLLRKDLQAVIKYVDAWYPRKVVG